MIGGCGPCPFFSYTLAFALQLRKSTENLRQGTVLKPAPISLYTAKSSQGHVSKTHPNTTLPPTSSSHDLPLPSGVQTKHV
jgi:hypothetical protein